MILGLCVAVLVITMITCEPPVNSYLPPRGGRGDGGRPGSQYGTPESSLGGYDGFNSGRGQARNNFDPSKRGSSALPSAEYGLPGQGSQGFQGSSRGRQGGDSSPSSQYRSPNQESSGRVRGGFENGRESSQRPESSYGPPLQGFSSPGQNGFNSQSGSSQGQGSGKLLSGSPTSVYGTPDFGNDRDNTNQNYRRSGVDESNEPAKYEFSYEVDDAETGTMFGHSEQRDGDLTTGQYNVVLPDGRKQVVEYEANKDGYKPQIRYEGAGGRGGAGFGRGGFRENDAQSYPSASANAEAYADTQPGIAPQGGSSQQPGFGQSTSGGYLSGRPANNGQNSFGNQGFPSAGIGGGYPKGSRGSGFLGGSQGGDFSSGRGGQGYSNGSQGGQGSLRREGPGTNRGDGGEGYPSGAPNGVRGSGY